MGDSENIMERARERLAGIEESRAQLDAQLEAIRASHRGELAAVLDPLIEQAQSAWSAGHRFLTFRLPNEESPRALPTVLRRDVEFRSPGETNWANALSRITEIGWRLHTWTVVVDEGHFVPVPLFERPV